MPKTAKNYKERLLEVLEVTGKIDSTDVKLCYAYAKEHCKKKKNKP